MSSGKIKKLEIPREFKILDNQVQKAALKSVKSLQKHLYSTGTKHEAIYLIVDTHEPTSKKRELTPRVVAVHNRIKTVRSQKILLITKDPVSQYKTPIEQKGSSTEDTFDNIIGFKKLKSIVHSPKSITKLYHEYDLIVIDQRLHKLLPELLSKTIFCKNNKKFPLMIQMAKPDPHAQLVKSKKSSKLKDDRIEPEYIQKQIRSICKNTTCTPSTGTCLAIVIGYSDLESRKLVENMDCVLEFLTSQNFRPVGGLIHNGMAGVSDVHIKTADSVSLPVIEKKRESK